MLAELPPLCISNNSSFLFQSPSSQLVYYTTTSPMITTEHLPVINGTLPPPCVPCFLHLISANDSYRREGVVRSAPALYFLSPLSTVTLAPNESSSPASASNDVSQAPVPTSLSEGSDSTLSSPAFSAFSDQHPPSPQSSVSEDCHPASPTSSCCSLSSSDSGSSECQSSSPPHLADDADEILPQHLLTRKLSPVGHIDLDSVGSDNDDDDESDSSEDDRNAAYSFFPFQRVEPTVYGDFNNTNVLAAISSYW